MNQDTSHPTQRFSKTIDYYHKYRPRYPVEVIDLIENTFKIDVNAKIADVGSGTGILTEQLLTVGCHVYAVEPNREMRECAEENLKKFPNFESLEGTAEKLPMADNSVDVITAAQAFHWFDILKVKTEFQRVLRNNGWVVLLWNFRNNQGSAMMEAYEKLLTKYGTDYKKVAAENISEDDIKLFFGTNTFQSQVFENVQVLDLEGLKGRLLSTSYTPKPGDSHFEDMMAEAERVFHELKSEGHVHLLYNTTVYYRQI